MKKIFFLFILTANLLNSNAQSIGMSVGISNDPNNTNCDEFIKKEIIKKLTKYKPTDLVPFSTDGNHWSLMDVNSKKIVTAPLFNGTALSLSFKPDLEFDTETCYGIISKNYIVKRNEISVMDVRGAQPTINELGFQVNANGVITDYSKSYNDRILLHPVKYQGIFYTVINDEENNFLINQNGEKIPNFVFKKIVPIQTTINEEPLFFVIDSNNVKGIITFSGKKLFYGEILNRPCDEYFGYVIQYDLESGCGYNNLEKITRSGVLDLSTQKWIIAPQTKYKIYSMIYTSSQVIEDEHAISKRNKVNIYFLAEQKGKYFVIDKNGNAIKPKGY